jgi:hypothetical protein
MSLAQNTNTNLYVAKSAEHKRSGYGFVLALLGIAVALVIASATSPVSIGKGMDDVNTFVGP